MRFRVPDFGRAVVYNVLDFSSPRVRGFSGN